MHEDHRKRVRQRFMAEGIDHMPEHNILELLLFYSIPRKDTNELAHRLIEQFGSLSGVFEASPQRLMGVEGVGENTAALITLIPQVFKYATLQKQSAGHIFLEDSEKLKEYVRSLYIGARTEIFHVLCFDGTGKLVNTLAHKGEFTHVGVDNRILMDFALTNKSSFIVISHNHPHGAASPSGADVESTRQLVRLFFSVGIRIKDHIIVSDDDIISMAHIPKFYPYFI